MLYKCEHCNYITKRIRDLNRHINRKNPCYKKNKEEVCNLEERNNITLEGSIITPEGSIITPEGKNITPEGSIITPNEDNDTNNNKTELKCIKCNKQFKSLKGYKEHISRCNGLHPLQCVICLKMFASAVGKSKHKKYVKCSPPIQHNNQTTNNNYNNCHNTTNNNNIYNINIRTDFDKISNEDIQNMVSRIAKAEYLKMVNKNIDIGKYVIPRTMEHIYFNDDFPEMQALKKERRNDKMVEVYVGDGKWEKRMMNDVCKDVVGRVENFHTEYLKYVEDKYKDVKVGSPKWKQIMRPIKTFGNTMLWYDGFRGDEIENIGVELNFPDDDDETEREREKRNKEMEQLVGEKVYDESKVREQVTTVV